jgi:chemotaxis protein MotB
VRRPQLNSGDDGGNTAGWLTTFNDLVTLLMVFFVLLFTMSSIDAKQLKEFQYALQSGLGILEEGRMANVSIKTTRSVENPSHVITHPKGIKVPEKRHLPRLLNDKLVQSLEANFEIEVTETLQGIRLSFEDQILFDFGKAKVNPAGYSLLNQVAKVIKKVPNPVRVEGHTDNIPIRTSRFPSNWELSVARAVNVVKYFTEICHIDPRRLSAVGYGESRPIVANNTPANRTKNRRVEILLMMEDKQENAK